MPNTQLQLRRGTTAEHAVFTGALGELTVNTTTKRLHLHDGTTAGGAPLPAVADLSNLVTTSGLTSTLAPYALTANVHNVPAGGSTGQVLAKSSATDYALTWVAPNLATVQDRTFASATYTLQLGDSYIRVKWNSGAAVVQIPNDSTVNFPIGTQITIFWNDANSVQITNASGVGIYAPDPAPYNLRKPGSSVTITKVAANSWDLAGDMKLA